MILFSPASPLIFFGKPRASGDDPDIIPLTRTDG